MTEVNSIVNASVGGEQVERHEALEVNEISTMRAEAGFQTSGESYHGPLRALQPAPLGGWLQRLCPMGGINMATTDVPMTTIGVVDPWAGFVTDAYMSMKLNSYRYIRGTIVVEAMVNVPAGCYGLYYLVAIPNGSGSWGTTGNGFVPAVVECCPHVAIDLSASTKVKLELPWLNWNDYGEILDTTSPDGLYGMWAVRLVCYHPITQGNGSTVPSGTVSLYVKCAEDAEVLIPFPQSGKEPQAITRGRAAINGVVTRATGGMKASAITGSVASAAKHLVGIPVIGALAAPVAAGAAAVTSVLSYLGFTRTTEQRTPQPVVPRPFANVANVDVPDTSEVAALTVGNAITIDPRVMSLSGEDESSFDYLTQRYVLVARLPWTTADARAATIGHVVVTPFYAEENTASNGAGAVFPMGGYLGLPFAKWRADMEYKLVIPVSKFHRGALQLSWAPGVPGVNDPTNNQFNQIFDVTANKTWEFTVGYADARFMLDSIPRAHTDPILSPLGANGILRFTVVTPLEAPTETADTVIFVFARVKPGAQYAMPRTTWRPIGTDGSRVTADFASTVYLQSGALGDDGPETVVADLVPSAGPFPLKDVAMGEEVLSARMLVQKFSQDKGPSRALLANGSVYEMLNHTPLFPAISQHLYCYPSAPNTNPMWFNWFGWYSALFLGVASSTRYKIMNTGATAVPLAVHPVNTLRGVDVIGESVKSVSTISPTWVVGTGEAVEITVPYYFEHKYLPTLGARSTEDLAEGTYEGRVDLVLVPPLKQGDTVRPSLVFYSAAGPDVRFHCARFPRRVFYYSSGTPLPQYGNTPYS